MTGPVDPHTGIPVWASSDGWCIWRVYDLSDRGYRLCGGTGLRRYDDLTFCRAHDRMFLAAVMNAIEEQPWLRTRMLNRIRECEREEQGLPDRPPPPAPHCVYFAEREGFVKIGRAVDVRQRMRAIGRGSCMPQGMQVGPVRLLATIDCDCQRARCVREKYFHGRFEGKWLEGEWFRLDAELTAFIGGLQGCVDDRLRAGAAA